MLIIAINVGFTGCDKIDNLVSSVRQSSNIDSSVSQSFNIDYNQYIKKVWIVDNSINNQSDYYESFNISSIENNKISGELSLIDISLPYPGYCSSDDTGYWGNFTGKVNGNTADCQFKLRTGDTGNIKLDFEPNSKIKAVFTYKSMSQEIKDEIQDLKLAQINLHLDGTYQFRPYNLKDIKIFKLFEDQSFTVDLNSWGNVRFISDQEDSGKHVLTNCYLTDKAGDILFYFIFILNFHMV